jgi:hypothetical protein
MFYSAVSIIQDICCGNMKITAYTKHNNVHEMTNVCNYTGLIFYTVGMVFRKVLNWLNAEPSFTFMM